MPALSDVEHETLQAWADYARQAPMAFYPAHQVFPNPDQARLQVLARLHEQGYLERQQPPGHAYRLSGAGWAALGLHLVHVDLSQF